MLLFEGLCQFAGTVVPRSIVISRLRLWAVPAQAPEGVCPPTTSVSSAVPGSLASPFHGAPEPADPHAARPPPGPRSTRFARSAPYGTGRLTAATHNPTHTPGSSEPASTIGPQEFHATKASQKGTSCPARRGRKGYKYIQRDAAAGAAAGAITLD